MNLGMEGIGIYWCLIECLYENGGYLDLKEVDLLAFEFRVDKKIIEDLIDNYDLFKKNKKSFYSKSVLKRLEKINEISNKNRENVRKRWQKEKETRDEQTFNESNTTVLETFSKKKEKKIKKNKIKNIINTTTTTIDIYSYIEDNFGRTLSPIEFNKINSWLSLYKEDVIKHAIEIAVMKSNKTFAYVDGILKNWKGQNLNTLQQILENEKQRHNQTKNNVEMFEYDWLNEKED